VHHPNSGADGTATSRLSRRRVLAGGGKGLLALALAGTAAAACGPGGPPTPDPLEAALEAARRDSDLADLAAAAAKAAAPWLVPALNVVAAERARHATALVEELARAAGRPTPTSTPETGGGTALPSTDTETTAGPPPTVQDVVTALRTSAGQATDLVPTVSGYRAGLMGSIAAACTAAYTVGLPPPLPPSPARRPR